MQITDATHQFLSQSARASVRQVQQRLIIEPAALPAQRPSEPPSQELAAESTDERKLSPQQQLNIRILVAFVEKMFGVRLEDLVSPSAKMEKDAGWRLALGALETERAPRVRFERVERFFEAESITVGITAQLDFGNGRRLDGELFLRMDRSFYSERHFSLETGRRQDPLVLNFNGQGVALLDQRLGFDLRADGSMVAMPVLAPGNAMLTADRNGDGRINDGSEVLGARSGDAWSDLRRLDADGNGFIDAQDPAFQTLRLWERDGSGKERLSSLAERGVRAIGLQHIGSPFALKDGHNQELGVIRSTGYFLDEQFRLRPAQQIDLTV
ncbi:hypothetical protein [Algiphilus sp.]|uniref:hypothetical protein n=1 Tax=Algiphilus sp. TaxID=1872431 RepID=UPI003B5246BC